jgi:hypothetical protein
VQLCFFENYFNPQSHVVDHQHEISGSNARLTLLRLWVFITKQREKTGNDTVTTRRVQRLLGNLCHIQHLAYSMETERNSKTILAMHNLTYVFALDYMKVSSNIHYLALNIIVLPLMKLS